jgi:DNA-binding NarL/FixJ family response regulator
VTRQVGVVAADARPLLLEAVARVVRQEPAFRLIATAHDGRGALALLRSRRPDVAVLHADLPEQGGAALLAAAARDAPGCRVVLIAEGYDPDAAYTAVAAGAAACLTTAATGEELRRAIHAVVAGGAYIDAAAQTQLASGIRARERTPQLLTDRELDVLRGVASGRTARAIGLELHLAERTVKGHLEAIYAKLDVSTGAAAVATAIRTGLLE